MGKKKERYAVYVVKGKEAGGIPREYETVDEGEGPWEWAQETWAHLAALHEGEGWEREGKDVAEEGFSSRPSARGATTGHSSCIP